jgi:hypothetical protein
MTENPCVAGSIPADTTKLEPLSITKGLFNALNWLFKVKNADF